MQALIAIVSSFAPLLGTLLGSPVAGAILSLLASHYGLAKKFDTQSLIDAISANPAQLKQLENQHQENLLTMLEDMALKSEQNISWVSMVIALVAALATIGAILMILYWSIMA